MSKKNKSIPKKTIKNKKIIIEDEYWKLCKPSKKYSQSMNEAQAKLLADDEKNGYRPMIVTQSKRKNGTIKLSYSSDH